MDGVSWEITLTERHGFLPELPRLSDRAAPATFEEMYRDHGARVLGLAFRCSGNEELARDLTKDIFVKVYENLGSFRNESDPYTWIHRIALNHIMNVLKRERRFRWIGLMEESVADAIHDDRPASAFSMHSPAPGPDRILEQSEREAVVQGAIASLPVKYRIPFVLFRYDGLSYLEIAGILNLSLSAVEARIHRAKKQLIKNLTPWLGHI